MQGRRRALASLGERRRETLGVAPSGRHRTLPLGLPRGEISQIWKRGHFGPQSSFIPRTPLNLNTRKSFREYGPSARHRPALQGRLTSWAEERRLIRASDHDRPRITTGTRLVTVLLPREFA